jgi:hypothetical protein
MEKEVINGKEYRCREKRQGRLDLRCASHSFSSFSLLCSCSREIQLSSPLQVLSPPHLDVSPPPRISVRGEICVELWTKDRWAYTFAYHFVTKHKNNCPGLSAVNTGPVCP